MAKTRDTADTPDTPEAMEQQLRTELKIYGFAAAKQIAEWRGELSGEMPCPMCGEPLKYSTARSNGHFAAFCSRDGCLNMME